jgi:hypothetical protein
MLSGGSVTTSPALMGNATATLFNNNSTVTLNLEDPDSLSQATDGRAVLTSQGDGELVFVNNLGANNQLVGVLELQNAMVDDTAFGGARDDPIGCGQKGQRHPPRHGHLTPPTVTLRPKIHPAQTASSAYSTRLPRRCPASTASWIRSSRDSEVQVAKPSSRAFQSFRPGG